MKNDLTININTDKPCSHCGAKGATDNGLCLECISKKIEERYHMKIGNKTIQACIDTVQSMLWEHHAAINKAFTITPGALDISIKLKITPNGNLNDVEGGISFVIEKLKDAVDPIHVNEDQMDLFKEGDEPCKSYR